MWGNRWDNCGLAGESCSSGGCRRGCNQTPVNAEWNPASQPAVSVTCRGCGSTTGSATIIVGKVDRTDCDDGCSQGVNNSIYTGSSCTTPISWTCRGNYGGADDTTTAKPYRCTGTSVARWSRKPAADTVPCGETRESTCETGVSSCAQTLQCSPRKPTWTVTGTQCPSGQSCKNENGTWSCEEIDPCERNPCSTRCIKEYGEWSTCKNTGTHSSLPAGHTHSDVGSTHQHRYYICADDTKRWQSQNCGCTSHRDCNEGSIDATYPYL